MKSEQGIPENESFQANTLSKYGVKETVAVRLLNLDQDILMAKPVSLHFNNNYTVKGPIGKNS